MWEYIIYVQYLCANVLHCIVMVKIILLVILIDLHTLRTFECSLSLLVFLLSAHDWS
jgi:hypothetical protein